MYKDSLYNRINTVHDVLFKHRNYLHRLPKILRVWCDFSPYMDLNIIFNSKYGKAEIIIYKESNRTVFKYYGDIEFEWINKRTLTCDYTQDNRLRELELYIYEKYGIPEIKVTLIEQIKERLWKLIKKN